MTKPMSRIGVVALGVGLAGTALAQETTDWSVIQQTDPVECYAVSRPTSQENTRNDRPVEVTRSDTVLYVLYRPLEELSGQVVFKGGYPSAPESPVTLDVDGTQFTLSTEGEWAWPAGPEEDGRVIEAFRRGSEAVLTAQSSRGTVTRDTFSLIGFSRSVDEAQRLCGN